MHADPKHRGLMKYREARQLGKDKALLRLEILEKNPQLAQAPNRLNAIVEGAMRARQAQPTRQDSRRESIRMLSDVRKQLVNAAK